MLRRLNVAEFFHRDPTFRQPRNDLRKMRVLDDPDPDIDTQDPDLREDRVETPSRQGEPMDKTRSDPSYREEV